MADDLVCDLCGQPGRTRFCDVCGVDYCEDCSMGAHPAVHELTEPEYERARRWADG